jgi:hypothetical protein
MKNKTVAIFVIGLLLIMIISFYVVSSPNEIDPSLSNGTTQTTSTTSNRTSVIESSKLVWRKLLELNGSGKLNTETFEVVGDSWRIKWKTKGSLGYLRINVYDENGTLVSMTADQQGDSENATSIYFNGQFYLYIDAENQEWKIDVEEEVPGSSAPIKSIMPSSYRIIKTWFGAGDTETEIFEINTAFWRISWTISVVRGLTPISIYDDQGSLISEVGNSESGKGYSYIYSGKGHFYLKIDTENMDWAVYVEEPNP